MSRIRLKDCLLIVLGGILYALVLNMLIIPHEFGEGGITGVALLFYYTLGMEAGVTSFILNGFLLVLAYRFLSKVGILHIFSNRFYVSDHVFDQFSTGAVASSNSLSDSSWTSNWFIYGTCPSWKWFDSRQRHHCPIVQQVFQLEDF